MSVHAVQPGHRTNATSSRCPATESLTTVVGSDAQKEAWIGEAIGRLTNTMVEIFEKGGLVRKEENGKENNREGKKDKKKEKVSAKSNVKEKINNEGKGKPKQGNVSISSDSEETIYKRAVEFAPG